MKAEPLLADRLAYQIARYRHTGDVGARISLTRRLRALVPDDDERATICAAAQRRYCDDLSARVDALRRRHEVAFGGPR